MDKTLRALHLASFLGNIGDYANHQGFCKKFKEILPIEFTQLEIRKFYKNRGEMKFDDAFIDLINQHDVLILGGGGFFDLKWDYSNTGTTMDFSEELINKIKIPVLVNAMGYHEYGDVKEENILKFKNFLGIISQKKNWLISVRNDGSFSRMQARYPEYMDQVMKVPDHGFFFSPENYSRLGLQNQDAIWIGLNVTNDLFNEYFNKDVTAAEFNRLMSEGINQLLGENNRYKIILFPHVHQDIATIGTVLEGIEDRYKRENMVVAPLLMTSGSIEHVFDLYRICSVVIGMRFHTNVCGMSMNIPTVGLAGHEQISSLYDEFGLSERCIKVDNTQFFQELSGVIKSSLGSVDQIKKKYSKIMVTLNSEADAYRQKVVKWLDSLQ